MLRERGREGERERERERERGGEVVGVGNTIYSKYLLSVSDNASHDPV